MIDFERILKFANKSGRILVGSKTAIEAAQNGKAVALIIASNCPSQILDEIQYHASLSNVPVHIYPNTSADLGMACEKPFAVSAVTIRSLTDANFLNILRNPKT